MAPRRRASATAALAPRREEGRRLGRPLWGVSRETHDSRCVAGHPQLRTGPPPSGPSHEVPDGAPPSGEADRHVTQELPQKRRGRSAIERPADAPPSQAAPLGADEGLAGRTVRRDEGPEPLEPPGVQWSPTWPLLVASGARGMGAPPSAVLKQRSPRRAVLPLCPQACAPLVSRGGGLHHLAHGLTADPSRAHAPSRLRPGVPHLPHRGAPDGRLSVVASVEKIPRAWTPPRVEDVKPPLGPRTTHELERFRDRLKPSRRHLTGRQNPHAWIRRAGSWMAMLFGLPDPPHRGATVPRGNPEAVHHTLPLVRQPEKRRQGWHARHDFAAYLAALEPPGVSHE